MIAKTAAAAPIENASVIRIIRLVQIFGICVTGLSLLVLLVVLPSSSTIQPGQLHLTAAFLLAISTCNLLFLEYLIRKRKGQQSAGVGHNVQSKKW
jgi:uncharacterized membrane protein YbhN (UPF0104 family)